jgi:predicted nucleotidyltransferase component of viral defense system
MNELKNIPASVQQRLLNQARLSGRPYNELLQYFAIERFLYRLSQSEYAGCFVLKGALLFLASNISLYRPTKDIDFLGYTSNDIQNVEKIFQNLCQQSVEIDGLVFDPQSVQGERIKEDAAYEGVRIHLTSYLGKAKILIQIDIGYADAVFPAPINLDYPSILQMPAPHLRVYTWDSVVAEKLQAMVYLGNFNSRMKDFYDLWTLAKQFDFDGARLQESVRQTFNQRGTVISSDTPTGLTERFAIEKQMQWLAFLRRIRIDVDVPPLLEIVHTLNDFLLPILQSIARDEIFSAYWKAGYQWNDIE